MTTCADSSEVAIRGSCTTSQNLTEQYGRAIEAGHKPSIIGRRLHEISWEGSKVKLYRDGGRGMENPLTV